MIGSSELAGIIEETSKGNGGDNLADISGIRLEITEQTLINT